MIIGSILETSTNGGGTQNANLNGASSVVFYTMQEAIIWATLQSRLVVYGSGNWQLCAMISIVNTETNEHRWWFSGTEYTG